MRKLGFLLLLPSLVLSCLAARISYKVILTIIITITTNIFITININPSVVDHVVQGGDLILVANNGGPPSI